MQEKLEHDLALFYPIGCDFLDIIVIESAHDEMIFQLEFWSEFHKNSARIPLLSAFSDNKSCYLSANSRSHEVLHEFLLENMDSSEILGEFWNNTVGNFVDFRSEF